MPPEHVHVLQLACDHAHERFIALAAALLVKVEAALAGRGSWPDPQEYEIAEAQGRKPGVAIRSYLQAVGVPARPTMSREIAWTVFSASRQTSGNGNPRLKTGSNRRMERAEA
ncbi:hypothetical protein [Variovorax sp. KK3]|uniref:hypothetical protein n=1 Tax=Variovorax sp. KK3 TaxID=1855728 RepID=UPI0011813F71|nr:hypothetical protein [Variovorax sp. KK3]